MTSKDNYARNVTAFTNKDTLEDEASLWISRIDRGLSQNERKALNVWVRKSQAHNQGLLEFAELWDDMSVLNELSNLFPLEQQVDYRRRVFSLPTRMSLAASFIGVMLVASLWLIHLNTLYSDTYDVVSTNQHTTQKGKQKLVSLADGTVVHLNTDSSIRVDYTDTERRVTLVQGEAHFDIFHNPNQPFILEAQGKTVTALGTSFGVEITGQSDIQVLVTEGKISVDQELSDSTIMTQGQTADFHAFDITEVEQISPEQIQKVLAWQQGMLVFQGETLLQVLNEVSRYNDISFDVLDSDAKQKRVAGYFKIGDVQGLLKTLENNFAIDVQQTDSSHYLLSSS